MKTSFFITLLLSICVFNSCKEEVDATPPVLKNLLIEFADYDPATQTAGDFTFLNNFDQMFYQFGYRSGPTLDDLGAEFGYIIKEDALVKAPCDGIITRLTLRDDGDYNIIIKNQENSIWFTQVDHLLNVVVEQGDRVTAGQVLGNPGFWDNVSGLGVVELSVINDEERRNYCPFSFFDPATRATYEAKVQKLMDDWEAFKGDDTIYDKICVEDWYDTE